MIGAGTNKWHQNLMKEIQPNIYCDQVESMQ